MATVRTIRINGTRHVVEDDDCLYEKRCDACGEFAAQGRLIELHVAAKGARVNPGEFVLDVHDHCLGGVGLQIEARIESEPPF